MKRSALRLVFDRQGRMLARRVADNRRAFRKKAGMDEPLSVIGSGNTADEARRHPPIFARQRREADHRQSCPRFAHPRRKAEVPSAAHDRRNDRLSRPAPPPPSARRAACGGYVADAKVRDAFGRRPRSSMNPCQSPLDRATSRHILVRVITQVPSCFVRQQAASGCQFE